MYENWLSPITPPSTGTSPLSGRMASKVQFFKPGEVLRDVRVAFIGVSPVEADQVRKHLYALSWTFGKLGVADLGNARREDASFLTPLLSSLLEEGICPVLIGKEESTLLAQFAAHHGWQKSVSVALVDEKLSLWPQAEPSARGYLFDMLEGKQRLFHFAAIGLQGHFLDESVVEYMNRRYFDRVHLGTLRSNLQFAEPFVRDADMLAFNLGVLKRIEVPGVPGATPAGLFSEEACQIVRYAGMSDKLASIGFYGFDTRLDPSGATAAVVAQLVWYFLEGFANRKNDFPVSMEGLMEYIVPVKDHDYQLTFWKSNKSGRWWLQVPVHIGKGQKRHRLLSCSYQDYLDAINGKLPDRFIQAFRRFDV